MGDYYLSQLYAIPDALVEFFATGRTDNYQIQERRENICEFGRKENSKHVCAPKSAHPEREGAKRKPTTREEREERRRRGESRGDYIFCEYWRRMRHCDRRKKSSA